MRGLDPRIHLLREKVLRKGMDCRVKPGNDGLMLRLMTHPSPRLERGEGAGPSRCAGVPYLAGECNRSRNDNIPSRSSDYSED